MILTKEQIEENERYFINLLSTMSDGGSYAWKDLNEILVKKYGKLVCPQKAYDVAKEITSQEFFEQFFILIK